MSRLLRPRNKFSLRATFKGISSLFNTNLPLLRRFDYYTEIKIYL
jgi:hypothetical protein